MSESDCLLCPTCGSDELDQLDECIRGGKFIQERRCRICMHIITFKFKIIDIKIKDVKTADDQYLFVTDQGVAIAPDGETVENLQMLGIAPGASAEKAFQSLISEEPWIKKKGYTEVAAYRLDLDKITNVKIIEV